MSAPACAPGRAVRGSHTNKNKPGEGSLFRAAFGNTLQEDYGITVSGLIDMAYSRNNRSTHQEREHGLSSLSLNGMSDEGLELGSALIEALIYF